MAGVTITTFAEVQAALDNYVGPPNNFQVGSAPHGVFWHQGATQDDQYQYFTTQNAIPGYPIIEVGNGPGSNIINALQGTPPFNGGFPPRMPVGGPPWLDQPTIDAISAWITAGAKQFGNVETTTAAVSITTFAEVQKMLDDYVGPPNNFQVVSARHHVFWHQGATQDEQYQYFVTQNAIPGFKILEVGNGPASNIINALQGTGRFSGGFPQRMPIGGPPWLEQSKIDAISAWITAGAKQFAAQAAPPKVGY
jgi:hypothetical protein